jgi:hypothetical protein
MKPAGRARGCNRHHTRRTTPESRDFCNNICQLRTHALRKFREGILRRSQPTGGRILVEGALNFLPPCNLRSEPPFIHKRYLSESAKKKNNSLLGHSTNAAGRWFAPFFDTI